MSKFALGRYALKAPIYCPNGFRDEVLSKLGKDLRWSNVSLTEHNLYESSTSPIANLVFCLLNSRIGEDICSALTGIDEGW